MKFEVTVVAASLTAAVGKPCNTSVSKGPGMRNVECRAMCEAGDVTFDDKCLFQHYTLENQNSRPDACFNKWVYGYSEPPNLSSFKTIPTVTPALCQAECQAEDECFNWIWTTEYFAPSGGAERNTCYLKTKKQVENALGASTSVPITDTKHCNYGLTYQCTNHLYNCLECGGDMRCVWESDNHVNGWKYCGDTDVCAPAETIVPPPMTTPAATPEPTEPLTEASTTTPPSTTTTVAETLPGGVMPTITQAPPVIATITAETLPGGVMPSVEPPGATTASAVGTTLPGGVMPSLTTPGLTAPESSHNHTDESECVPATKPSACEPNCACAGSGGCGCCNVRAVEIRVMDRPKHFEFHLEN